MPVDGHGLRIVDRNESDPRLKYYRFDTAAIGWDPGINVLLPSNFDPGARYPVLYLLHGGAEDFRVFDYWGIRERTVDKPIIIVMPDGGYAGWYSNPVTSNVGPRNWETFHLDQLVPWIDDNFRTHAAGAGRAVAGFSMGGFGALKYAGKRPAMFASVSAHSGPASLRYSGGIVVHWANFTSFAFELGGGTVYGVPWNEARVDADDPSRNVTKYRGKRIFLVAGTSPDPVELFDFVTERVVLGTQRAFTALLRQARIPFQAHERPGGHFLRPDMFVRDLDGIIATLTPAG